MNGLLIPITIPMALPVDLPPIASALGMAASIIEISTLDFSETAQAGDVLAALSVYDASAAVSVSTLNFDETAQAGDVLSALEVGMAWTFTLIDDAGGRFALSGNNLVRGMTALNHKTTPAPTITVEASDGKRVRRRTFVANVRGVNAWSPMHAKLDAGEALSCTSMVTAPHIRTRAFSIGSPLPLAKCTTPP